jgi:hypothetical protein
MFNNQEFLGKRQFLLQVDFHSMLAIRFRLSKAYYLASKSHISSSPKILMLAQQGEVCVKVCLRPQTGRMSMPIARDKRLVGALFFIFLSSPLSFLSLLFGQFDPFSIEGRAEVIAEVTSKLMAGESSRVLIHGDISYFRLAALLFSTHLSINIGNLA